MSLLMCLTFLQADLLRYRLKVFSQAELLSGSPGKFDFRRRMTKIPIGKINKSPTSLKIVFLVVNKVTYDFH